MKLELVTKTDVSYVELQRDKRHSLGFTIADGTPEEKRPVVKNVNINGPAAKSFAVAKGDVILSVNGFSTAGKKSKDVRRMLDDAGSNVNLEMLYVTHETRILGSCVFRKQQLTMRLQKIKGSFGFLLRKCSKYSFIMEYPIVSNIKEGSPIQKSGHLQDGDRLLMIDNVSLSWMSLSYIASILQAKDEAEFTFEYNVRVGIFSDFAEMDATVNLEIDASVINLGICFRMCDDECSVMYISAIRQGSAAERCGIFSEGDVVRSINDIDSKNLTVSRANFLLKNVKKSRKISFISNRQKEVETLNENTGLSSSENTATTESFASGIQAPDWKHSNTPASSNFAFVGHQKYNFQSFCYTEQIKSMDKFQNIFSIMSSLKQVLSTLTRQAFRGTQISLNQNCTSCNNTKHTVKLCTSCLAKMNVKCAQSLDVLRELVGNFVRFSLNMFDGNDEQKLSVSLKSVIHMLKETLSNILPVPELQEHLNILAEKVACADTSCNVCDTEIRNITMIVKQLLLVLSTRDNRVEFSDLVEQLVSCLLDVKLPCFGESEYIKHLNAAEENNSSFKNPSETVCIGMDGDFSSGTISCHIKNNSETESNQISHKSSLNSLQVETGVFNDYLILTHIQSMSGSNNSVSSKSTGESNRFVKADNENRTTSPKEIIAETSIASFASENLTGNRFKTLFKTMKLSKIWRSLDSLIKLKSNSDCHILTRSRNPPTFDHSKTAETTTGNTNLLRSTADRSSDLLQNINSLLDNQSKETVSNKDDLTLSRSIHNQCKNSAQLSARHSSARNPQGKCNPAFNGTQKRLLQDSNTDQDEESIVNGESTSSSSSIYAAETKSSIGTKKTYSETMSVTLKKENGGFGLGISDKGASELPVIDAIEPKSPSYNVGVLKLGDRIRTINGIRLSNLTSNQFSILKSKVLASDAIILTVEFDVYDEKYLFGSFDVVMDRKLKIGLIFEDMKKSSPMIVSGIVKGSGAHRSGQLFPGDEITFIKCTKNEEFDPLTCSYNKEENVTITVMRDPQRVLGLKERPHNPSPCYVNPCFHQDENVPQKGQNFVVTKTAVHSSRKNSLVVDHEVTLYRDSSKYDFGILLGEDPVTGRAYVTDIRPDGPAHKSGVIKIFDRIVEVDGALVDKSVENSVLDLLTRANHKVDLLIRRVYQEELTEI